MKLNSSGWTSLTGPEGSRCSDHEFWYFFLYFRRDVRDRPSAPGEHRSLDHTTTSACSVRAVGAPDVPSDFAVSSLASGLTDALVLKFIAAPSTAPELGSWDFWSEVDGVANKVNSGPDDASGQWTVTLFGKATVTFSIGGFSPVDGQYLKFTVASSSRTGGKKNEIKPGIMSPGVSDGP